MFWESSLKHSEEAEENKKEYLNLIDVTFRSGIDGNFSVKPTSFGLLIDREVCYRHIQGNSSKSSFI